MREQRFGMYLPIVFLVLMEVIVILQNGEGVNASAVQRWPKRNKADVAKVPSSIKSTDIRPNYPGGLLESKVPDDSIFVDILDRLPSILCAIFRLVFRQSYIFMSSGKTSWMEDISTLLNPLNPARPDQDSAEPSKNIISHLTSLWDYINPFKPDTSQKEPSDNDTTLIQAAFDYFYPFRLAANQQQDRQLANHRFKLYPSVVNLSNFSMPNLLSVPQNLGPDKGFKEYVRSIMKFLRNISAATLSIDLVQYLRGYINLLEDCVLETKPFGLLNRMERCQPADGEIDCFQLDTHVSQPAIDRPKSHKTVRNSVYPSYPTVRPLKHGSLRATDSLTSNSGTAMYLHKLRSNYLQRRTPPTHNCPNFPSDYHRVKGIPNSYKLHTSNLNWNVARMKCLMEGAQLALPKTQSQYDVMTDYMRSMVDGSDARFYVGFGRVSSGDAWTTILGDPLAFEMWSDHATSRNLQGKQCGVMLVSDSGDEGFASEPCEHPLPFMCEMMIPPECV